MIEIHVWATARFDFRDLPNKIDLNPLFRRRIKHKVYLHKRKPLNTGVFFNIHQTQRVRREAKKLHLIVLDDLDFTHGCADLIAIRIFENLIEVAKINSRTYIICADFLTRAEFSNANEAVSRIRDFKIQLDELENKNPDYFTYFDHEGYLDCSKYSGHQLMTPDDSESAMKTLISDLEDAPDGAYE